MRRSAWLRLSVLLALWPTIALAGLSERQIAEVAFAPGPGARIPMGLAFSDTSGRRVTLGEAIAGRPALLIPADMTCRQLCGPALTVAASALRGTGLVAGRDYTLVVVGIDPRDRVDDARRFAEGQVGGPGTFVLTGSAAAIDTLLGAIGYHVAADAERDAIAHPAVAITLTADGTVVRGLSTLALQPDDLRLALIEAGDGRIGGWTGRIALLCYGFDALHGIYTSRVVMILQAAGIATIAGLAGALGLLILRSRRPGASA